MNKKKAIRILEEQKQKVLSSDHPNTDEWTFETASYIKDFFGFKSTEYSWIAQFKWHVKTLNTTSDKEIRELLTKKPKKVVRFLDNCKRTLENKGLYKPEKKNWISDKGNDFLIKTAIGLIIFGFGIGYWTKQFEVFSILFNKQKQELITTSKSESLESLPSDITKKPADNINKNKSDNE